MLLAATHRELDPAVRRLRLTWQTGSVAEGEAAGRFVSAWVTGIGEGRAVNRLMQAVREHPPDAVIHFGFAGALDPQLEPAALLCLDRVCDRQGHSLPLCTAHQPNASAGTLLTLDRMVCTPTEKRAWFEHTGAIAVDMESFAVARYAHERRIALHVLRAVSDDASTALPASLTALVGADGRGRWLRASHWARTHPRSLPTLFKLTRTTARASVSLARTIENIVTGDALS